MSGGRCWLARSSACPRLHAADAALPSWRIGCHLRRNRLDSRRARTSRCSGLRRLMALGAAESSCTVRAAAAMRTIHRTSVAVEPLASRRSCNRPAATAAGQPTVPAQSRTGCRPRPFRPASGGRGPRCRSSRTASESRSCRRSPASDCCGGLGLVESAADAAAAVAGLSDVRRTVVDAAEFVRSSSARDRAVAGRAFACRAARLPIHHQCSCHSAIWSHSSVTTGRCSLGRQARRAPDLWCIHPPEAADCSP